jgi:cytidylate kinase
MSTRAGRAAVVTVDGPAGSGKSTLGRRIAKVLRVRLIDTGLFYRGVMVAALRAGVDPHNSTAVAEVAAAARIEVNTDPNTPPDGWMLRVNGRQVDSEARDPRHAQLLAQVSSLAEVRAVLLPRQRALADGGAVAVGRDCGTVVFPDAPVKIYLEASPALRAERRAEQLRDLGTDVDAVGLEAEITERDDRDSTRAVSPLRPAPDAHIINTGAVGVEEMVRIALDLCRAAGLVSDAEV